MKHGWNNKRKRFYTFTIYKGLKIPSVKMKRIIYMCNKGDVKIKARGRRVEYFCQISYK